MRRRMTPKFVLALGLATTIGTFFILAGLLIDGRNAVWNGDELYQCVNGLLYFMRGTRAAVRSFLSGQGLTFPSYSLNVGYGIDMYVLMVNTAGDIFNWPALLCPGKYVEYCYVGITFLRLMCCSWFFALYCLRNGYSYEAAFVGALCYTFGGHIAFGSTLRNPFFVTTAALFPLILVGADEIFRENRSPLFVVAMSLQVFASVYFTFMTCCMMLVYCLIKYFFGYRERSVRDFVVLVGRFIAHLAFAFPIAGLVLLPSIVKLLSVERLGLERINQLWYANKGIFAFTSDMISGLTYSIGLYIGPAAMFLLVVFVMCRKSFDQRFWYAAMLSVLLCIVGVLYLPIGRVLNAFTYPTSRWTYAYNFCFAYIACCTVPILKELDDKKWVKIVCVSILVMVASLALLRYVSKISTGVLLAYVLFGMVLSFAMPVTRACNVKVLSGALSAFMLLGVLSTSIMYCSEYGKNVGESYMRLGSVYKTVMSSNYASVADSIDDDSLFRYSAAKTYSMKNAAWNHKHFAIDYYKGLYNQGVDNLRSELGLSDDHFNFRFYGSDSRLALDGLTGSKYFIAKDDDVARVPYGYSFLSDGKNGLKVWESSHSLPLGFWTTSTVSRSEYEQLSMAEKQEALVQGCVVDDAVAEKYDQATVKISSQVVPSTIKADEGVIIEDGALIVTKGGSEIQLEFEGLPSSETYLQFKNLRYELLMPSELAVLRDDVDEGVDYKKKDFLTVLPTELTLKIDSETIDRNFNFSTGINKQYGGKHNWIVNVGYTENAQKAMTIKFVTSGKYTFDDFSVVCQPVAPVAASLDKLAPNGAHDLTFDGKHLGMSFTTDADQSLAVITVPFDKGWNAVVDGQPAEILRADTAFMAVELNGKGQHDVVLTYTYPILRKGLLLSIVGVVLFVGAVVVMRRREVASLEQGMGTKAAHFKGR